MRPVIANRFPTPVLHKGFAPLSNSRLFYAVSTNSWSKLLIQMKPISRGHVRQAVTFILCCVINGDEIKNSASAEKSRYFIE